MTQHL